MQGVVLVGRGESVNIEDIVGSVTSAASTYLLQMFHTTMSAVSSIWSPTRTAVEIL